MSGSVPPPSVRASAETTEASREERARDALLIGLTVATGVVDAISYLALGHIFTANMTGNVVFLALAVGQRNLYTALYSAAALGGFCVGAIVAGRVLLRPRPGAVWPRHVTLVLSGELACMAAFAALWTAAGGNTGGAGVIYLLIGLSSSGMGMQNAAARHLQVPGLTTTVVTTALTGLMVDLPALGVSGSVSRRAVWAVLALFAGAAVGATLVTYYRPMAPFVTVIAVAIVVAVAFVIFDRRTGADPHTPPN
jgi:uncharacterized membrane protein YoaK (UPF0700 family)